MAQDVSVGVHGRNASVVWDQCVSYSPAGGSAKLSHDIFNEQLSGN
jgi:hypothetical protein